MLVCLPRARINTRLGENGKNRARVEAVNSGPVNTTQTIEMASEIECRRIFAVTIRFHRRLERLFIGIDLRRYFFQVFFDLAITFPDQLAVVIKQVDGLFKAKNLFVMVKPFERLFNRLITVLAIRVAVAGQNFRMALTGNDRPQDLHTCLAGDVGVIAFEIDRSSLQK